jgi:uncharacterized protein YndB with AHSA1/START domain
MADTSSITVETVVHAPIATVWRCWTEPTHIMQWNSASPDWHTPRATNDLREGGTFTARMEAKDGSMGFDFAGTYTKILEHEEIAYTMGESGRNVTVLFAETADGTRVTEIFDPETENPPEMQRQGWQSILDSFKKHAESQAA